MIVTSYNNTQYDLSARGGPADAWVADGMFFEIDIATQKVLFEWKALDHLNLNASRFGFKGPGGTSKRVPWDWLHINSVQAVGENYLISARHHFSVYLISGKDGSVIWRLDGLTGGSFGSIPETFQWQHHARAHNVSDDGMTVTLFNNMVNGPKNQRTQTQALAYWLPMPASRHNPPVLVKRLETPSDPLYTATQGSYQFDLGNGNGFVGYGTVPMAREYGSAEDGSDLRWQARFGHDGTVQSYRVFKQPWKGTPRNWDPVVVFEDSHFRAQAQIPRAYVSWNGATDISGWEVYAGDTKDHLEKVGVAKKHGFETVFDLEGANCVRIGAIRHGNVIRTSNVACLEDDEAGLDGTMNDESDSKTITEPDQSNKDSGSNAVTELDQEELAAEKAQLEAEKEELEGQLGELEGQTWAAYRLFAEVACAVVLIVAGAWGYVLVRDWRRRRQYGSDDYDGSGFGFPLPRWSLGKAQRGLNKRVASGASKYDETKLDETTSNETRHRIMDPDEYSLSDDEDDDGPHPVSNRSRQPFLRQPSGV